MLHSWLEHRTVPPLMQVAFPGAERDFLPRVNFRCRLSFGVRTQRCAIACINICAHDKDPVVHVRVRWIMATQTYPASTKSDKKIINLMIVVAQAQWACRCSMDISSLSSKYRTLCIICTKICFSRGRKANFSSVMSVSSGFQSHTDTHSRTHTHTHVRTHILSRGRMHAHAPTRTKERFPPKKRSGSEYLVYYPF